MSCCGEPSAELTKCQVAVWMHVDTARYDSWCSELARIDSQLLAWPHVATLARGCHIKTKPHPSAPKTHIQEPGSYFWSASCQQEKYWNTPLIFRLQILKSRHYSITVQKKNSIFGASSGDVSLSYTLHLYSDGSTCLHKPIEWSQCCVTIVYSFHCTIWWLALLHPFIHFSPTAPPPCLYFSTERRIEKGAGDGADVTMTWMFSRQGLRLFCFSYTGRIVSLKQCKKQVLLVSCISSTMTTNNVKI